MNLIVKNKTFIICMILWSIITLLRTFCHQPWADEAWAWLIAKQFHFGNILEIIHIEGHLFVWYLILLPFAKLNIAYPYSMLIINWIFCFGAIFVLWKYSPFSNFLKIVISFSFPFLSYYSIVARCYSIGIFLLFILCALFKDRLKHPIIYSLLIFFCANTSAMALIGAFLFGIIFAYDLFKEKNKKDFTICSCVGTFTVITLLIQLVGVDKSTIKPEMSPGINLHDLLTPFIFSEWINAILLIIFGVIFCKAFFKDKKCLFFIIGTFSILLYIFNFWYLGDFWHYYFFYIYLIVSCWLFLYKENIDMKIKKKVLTCLAIISVLLIFDYRYEPRVFNSNSKEIANYVVEHKHDRNIFTDSVYVEILPYIDYKNYDFILKETKNKDITFDFVKHLIDDKKNNYLYVNNCGELQRLNKNGKMIKFIKVKNILDKHCIYKIDLK